MRFWLIAWALSQSELTLDSLNTEIKVRVMDQIDILKGEPKGRNWGHVN